MLQVIIFAGLVLLSATLIAVTIWRKLCWKPFYGILAAAALMCAVGVGVAAAALDSGKAGGRNELKESLFVASRLLQENKASQAVNALGSAAQIDEKYEDVIFLQALSLNLCESFELSKQLTEEVNDERFTELQEFNQKNEKVEITLVEELTDEVIDGLKLSEKTREELELWMRLRYYSEEPEAEVYGPAGSIRLATIKGDYCEAFELTAKQAENGGMEDKVLLSEMFVNNYEPFDYKNSDEEMDELLAKVTKMQIELEKMEAVMGEDGEGFEQVDYELKSAEYSMALADLERAPVLRAINYLKGSEPRGSEILGYHFQMAKLYYLADMEEEADKHMDQIFVETQAERGQWLGMECMMLLDGFFQTMDHPESEAFNEAYNTLFSGLNQGIPVQRSNVKNGFRSYINSYLRELYTGIRITNVKVAEYPSMTSVLTYAGTEDLTENDIKVIDTEHEITSFTLEKNTENSLAICFVLDRSGSMQGDRIANAKNALHQFIGNVEDDVKLGLVTFESSARIDVELTESKAVVNALVNDVAASGGTRIASGLEMGADVLQGFAGRKVIVLLSDGADGDSSKIQDVLNSLTGQGIPVYAVGLSGADNTYMQNIADTTDGTYISVDNSGDLFAIYQMIQNYIMNTYTLQYMVTEDIETEERELRVEMKFSSAFDTESYRLGLPEQSKEEYRRVPVANYYRQIGGSWRGEE